MAVDVVSDRRVTKVELSWFDPRETTPFALCGHMGPVLATVPFTKYGSTVREVWFGDDGWAEMDGKPIDDADILAFAIARPFYAGELDKVSAILGKDYEDKMALDAWLDAEQMITGGRTPRSMLEAGEGKGLVEALMTRAMRGWL